MVLNFHNNKRRNVAHGDEAGKTANLKPAKKMNELTWDCNLEREATDGAAKCTSYTKPDHGINEKVFTAGNTCNIKTKTQEVLNEWWNEIKANNLAADEKYQDNSGLGNFANMAFWETNAFACGTAKCQDGIRLLCIYNKLFVFFCFPRFKTRIGICCSGKKNDQQLYEAA
ncbi:SCP-like protein, partial [Necator americanus]